MSHRETITVLRPGGSWPEASGASFAQSGRRVRSGEALRASVCCVRTHACNARHPVAPECGPFLWQIPRPFLRTKKDRGLRSWDTNPLPTVALRLRAVNGPTGGAQGLAWPFDAKRPGLLLRKSLVMTATAPTAMNIGAFFQSVTSTSLGVGDPIPG